MNNSRWGNFRTRRTARWTTLHPVPVALLGDAVHTAHFSVGSGTKMAMEDAVALSRALAAHPENLESALAAYEAAAQPSVRAVQDSARPSLAWWENFGRYHDHFAPWQFGYHFLTRSITDARLGRRAPDFTAASHRAWRGVHGAEPLESPFERAGLALPGRAVPVHGHRNPPPANRGGLVAARRAPGHPAAPVGRAPGRTGRRGQNCRRRFRAAGRPRRRRPGVRGRARRHRADSNLALRTGPHAPQDPGAADRPRARPRRGGDRAAVRPRRPGRRHRPRPHGERRARHPSTAVDRCDGPDRAVRAARDRRDRRLAPTPASSAPSWRCACAGSPRSPVSSPRSTRGPTAMYASTSRRRPPTARSTWRCSACPPRPAPECSPRPPPRAPAPRSSAAAGSPRPAVRAWPCSARWARSSRTTGIRLLGPNTSGFIAPSAALAASFVPGATAVPAGRVAVVAARGGAHHALAFGLAEAGHGVSLAVGLGNAVDVTASDVLRHLADADDPDTSRGRALHVESVADGRRLVSAVRQLTERVPVVALVVGRHDVGAFAASHTGALATSWRTTRAALAQAGAVLVADERELITAVGALAVRTAKPHRGRPRRRRAHRARSGPRPAAPRRPEGSSRWACRSWAEVTRCDVLGRTASTADLPAQPRRHRPPRSRARAGHGGGGRRPRRGHRGRLRAARARGRRPGRRGAGTRRRAPGVPVVFGIGGAEAKRRPRPPGSRYACVPSRESPSSTGPTGGVGLCHGRRAGGRCRRAPAGRATVRHA